MRNLLLLVAVLAACQRHSSKCAPAVSGAVDRMVAESKSKMPPPIAANIARITPDIKKAITDSCEADKWAQPVIDCLSHANGREQLDACDAMLTPPQRANEHRHNDELLKRGIQPLDKPGVDKERRDPHAGLGIPPVNADLEGALSAPGGLAGSAGSAGLAGSAGSAGPAGPRGSAAPSP